MTGAMMVSHRLERDRCVGIEEDYQAHPDQLLMSCQRCIEIELATGQRVTRCEHFQRGVVA